MTRFARAKGSKACNERAPENATPWEVMKEQLLNAKQLAEDAKNREEAEKQRIENYENFLKERKVQKRKATWCDFPETVDSNATVLKNAQLAKKKKKNKNKNDTQEIMANKHLPENTLEINDDLNPLIKNKKKESTKNSKKNAVEAIREKSKEIEENKIETPKINKKKNKQKQKVEKPVQEDSKQVEEVVKLPLEKQVPKIKNKKNKFNNNETRDKFESNNTSFKNYNKSESSGYLDKGDSYRNTNKEVKKKKKFENGEHIRRKIINDNSFQLIINGKEVELVRYDGFPIMKKDAERLEELKTSMMKKGIPKSEVQRTMKLERRRAEKALARLKRDVCYNCRKGGHNLSDCPDLKSKIPGVEGADGMCFKCGSTEHRQFECKVQRDKEFRFATCFICREQGHIARQCPDNPKGLYPNGGCCKLCGDVTHLRKDCPTVQDKKVETSVKLDTLEGAENIEDIGQKQSTVSHENSKKPKKIKF